MKVVGGMYSPQETFNAPHAFRCIGLMREDVSGRRAFDERHL